MNSYMSPQGARWTANPLVVTATMCARMPSQLSEAAATTHGPASQIERNAPAGRSGRATGPAGFTGPAGPPVTAGAGASTTAPSEAAAPAEAAPTAASWAARSATGAAAVAAFRRGRPKA